MPHASKEEKELWVHWTDKALDNYAMPEDIDNANELANDLTDLATDYADFMLDEYRDRFGGGGKRSRRRRARQEDDEREEEEEEEEEEEPTE